MKTVWMSWMVAGLVALGGVKGIPAQAQSRVSVSARQAQGETASPSPVIKLWPGYGTNLSFLDTNETIVRVWIDDPSRVALDFDEPLCPTAVATDCVSGNPAVIHLRRIQGLRFENLPRAIGTLLTVITETAGGDRKLYQFRIEFATGEPEYHTISIQPTSPIHPVIGLFDMRRGLQIAADQDLIHSDQELWSRLQRFLTLVRSGVAVPHAAQQAGVSLEVITQLATWGAEARDAPPGDAATL